MGGCATMLQSAKCGATVVLVDNFLFSVCRIRDGRKFPFRLPLCYRQLSYMYDLCSCYFLKQGSHATVTMIPFYINLHEIFSHCRPIRYIVNMLRHQYREYNCLWYFKRLYCSRGQLQCDGTRAETRFRLPAKRTSPFKSSGAAVQSTTGSRGVRISSSNAGYSMFRGSVKGTGYPLHSQVSPSLPPVRHHVPSHFN
jgi:hypothetical protein